MFLHYSCPTCSHGGLVKVDPPLKVAGECSPHACRPLFHRLTWGPCWARVSGKFRVLVGVGGSRGGGARFGREVLRPEKVIKAHLCSGDCLAVVVVRVIVRQVLRGLGVGILLGRDGCTPAYAAAPPSIQECARDRCAYVAIPPAGIGSVPSDRARAVTLPEPRCSRRT